MPPRPRLALVQPYPAPDGGAAETRIRLTESHVTAEVQSRYQEECEGEMGWGWGTGVVDASTKVCTKRDTSAIPFISRL